MGKACAPRSARNGNSPAPYTKYKKIRYRYSWEKPNRTVEDESKSKKGTKR